MCQAKAALTQPAKAEWLALARPLLPPGKAFPPNHQASINRVYPLWCYKAYVQGSWILLPGWRQVAAGGAKCLSNSTGDMRLTRRGESGTKRQGKLKVLIGPGYFYAFTRGLPYKDRKARFPLVRVMVYGWCGRWCGGKLV